MYANDSAGVPAKSFPTVDCRNQAIMLKTPAGGILSEIEILRQSKPRFSNVCAAYGVMVSGDLQYRDGSRDP